MPRHMELTRIHSGSCDGQFVHRSRICNGVRNWSQVYSRIHILFQNLTVVVVTDASRSTVWGSDANVAALSPSRGSCPLNSRPCEDDDDVCVSLCLVCGLVMLVVAASC